MKDYIPPMSTLQTSDATLSITRVLVCTAAILALSMGIRHGFGLWLQPVTQAREWGRGDYGLAMAVQNLSWGLASIFAGMAADRFGAFRVVVVAAVLYALGMVAMAHADTVTLFVLSAGLMVGVAQAGSTNLDDNIAWPGSAQREPVDKLGRGAVKDNAAHKNPQE